jgi:hypothetical protein
LDQEPDAPGFARVTTHIEDEEWSRAGYDSLDSFYAAHETRHPDIRVYAAVRRDVPMADDPSEWPGLIGETIARRIVAHRRPPIAGI